MPGFSNPFSRPAKATGPSTGSGTQSIRSRKNLRKTDSSGSGGIVGPGRVLSKEERQQIKTERADSAAATDMDPEAQARREEYEWSFAALKDKCVATYQRFIAIPILDRLGRDIDTHWAPNAAANAFIKHPGRRWTVNLRALIVKIIWVLLVFGVLYQAFEYLLLHSRATACSVSTVFLPVTITVTANGVSPADAPDTTSTTNVSATSTSTHTVTAYETIGASSQAPPYVYTTDPSGSTHWIHGVSPTATSLVTLTTYVYTTPSDPADGDTTVMPVESFTPPAYTTTDYSFAGPETTLTSTSTSTNTVTYTLSYANTAGTESRSAFPGISSAGWNSTASSDVSVAPTLTSSVAPSASTYTSVYYTSSAPPTTSTTTTFITTTISRRLTVTLPGFSSEASPEGTESSSSPVSGGTSPLSFTTTTRSGTAVSPQSASMSSGIASLTILPIPTSLSTLLTSSGPYAPSKTTTSSHGSSISSLSSSVSSSSSLASPASNSGSLSSSVEITRTMSRMPASESSSMSSATSMTSQSSSISSGMSTGSAQTKTKPSVTTTLSSVGSSSSPESGSSEASNTGTQSSSDDSYGAPSAYTTLSTLPTATAASSAGSGSESSSASSSSVEISTTKIGGTHTHGSTSSAGSSSNQSPTMGSNSATTLQMSSSSSFVFSSYSPSSTSSGHSSSSSLVSSSSSSIVTTSSSSASKTESSSSFSNPFPPSSPSATPTEGCGEHGSFLVDFDNLPSFTPSNSNDTDITQAPPIENPYYHLTWSDGYVYAPQPPEPYTPVSQPHLAVFLADGTGKRVGGSQSGNFSKSGEISDGPREAISAFWFDAYSAWFGCDNRGPDACTLIFSAFSWSDKEKTEVLTDKSTSTIPPCNKSSGCGLSLVQFPSSFQSLSGLQIQAFVGEEERMFFMDDLSLNWTNNTCAAGLLRQSSS